VTAQRAFFGPPGVVVVVITASPNGPDPSGLAVPGSYTLLGRGGRSLSASAVRIAPVDPSNPNAPRNVTLAFPAGSVSRTAGYSLRIAFPGLVGRGSVLVLPVRPNV
jgi:hypothetical protein